MAEKVRMRPVRPPGAVPCARAGAVLPTTATHANATKAFEAARAEAEAERAEAVAQVEANIAQLRANAQGEIDTARANALAGAKGSVSELAVGAASKVLGRNVDAGSSQSVIDSYLASRGN